MFSLGDKPSAMTGLAAGSPPGPAPTLKHLLRALFLPLLIAPIQATTAELLYDSHIHYSANTHAEVPPERALALLEEAGITRAMVSSTPDDGTRYSIVSTPSGSSRSCAPTATTVT